MSNGYQDMMNEREQAKRALRDSIAVFLWAFESKEGFGVDVTIKCREQGNRFVYDIEVKDHEAE